MGKRAKRVSLGGAALLLPILWLFKDTILFVLGIPGQIDDLATWRDDYLPMLTADRMAYIAICLNLAFILYAISSDKSLRGLINKATVENPERVRSTPKFVAFENSYDPETGSLSPGAKLRGGMAEFSRLCDQAEQTWDWEAYYLAAELARMLRTTARRYAASGPSAATMERQINRRLQSLHEAFGVNITED